jgi:peptide/nickel transport system substrate-binding protein
MRAAPRWAFERLTRREALRVVGGTGLGMAVASLLGACGPQGAPGQAPPVPTQAAPGQTPAAPAGQTAPAGAQATPATAATPRDGGSLKYFQWTEDPPTLDPYLNVTFRAQQFAAFIYSRLLMSKKAPGVAAHAYIMEGDLAESWSHSDDGLTYMFKLRPNATWHNKPPMNGRPVTAQDVVWSFQRFMQVSNNKSAFSVVADVTAPDDHTVQFRLNKVYAPFESLLGSPLFWIMPREVVEQDGDASKRPIGSGPFIFDKLESGVSMTAKKNPNYYRPGEPSVDEVVSLIVPDTATQLAGLRAKELDYVPVAQQDLAALKKTNPEIQYVESENNLLAFIYWKLDQPPFNDVRVRQAVSMALNRDNAIQVIQAGRGNWNNAIPWAFSEWWLDPRGADMGPNAKYIGYDLATAKQLLAAAGYPNGFGVELVSTPGYGQVFVQSVELVQQDLKALGLDATIKMQEYSDYISSTFLGKFQSGNRLVYGLETPFTEPNDYLVNMYQPKGTRNHAGVDDAKLTAMLDQQQATLDRAERKKQIFEIQRYLAEQAYYPQYPAGMVTIGLTPRVRNVFPFSDYGLGAEVAPKLWLEG